MKKLNIRKLSSQLYFWVLIGIIFGGALGHFSPEQGILLKPVGDAFIALIKMMIAPLIFCSVTLGIAGAGDSKKIGRVGGKALLYFEVLSTVALLLGMLVANIGKPGAGFHVNTSSLDSSSVLEFSKKASEQSTLGFFLHIIPTSFFDAFTSSGDLLQVLLLALLFGFSLNYLGNKASALLALIESANKVFFHIISLIMKLAPLGAGAAMAFTIGKYGIMSIHPLISLMMNFYLACLLFIFLVLGAVAAKAGFNIFHLIVYLREELFTVLGTSSSESGLAPLMEKLERLGCSKSVVGLVVPAGYSFNLDGTNIYLSLATIFVAQALDIHLSIGQQLSIILVAMLTSKGASGVTGAGFITLAATFAVVPQLPVAGLTLILGVDRFMSEARALTNFIGNAVAAIVVSRWENELDEKKLKNELRPGAS